MTDADLIQAVLQYAAAEPYSSPGVEALFALARILEAEPELAGAGLLIPTVTGWFGFSAQAAAQRMIHITRQTNPETAVAWLRKVLAVREITIAAVKGLYGIKCSSRIQISDRIVLLPFVDLPQSETRDWIQQEHDAANERGGGLHGIKAPPTAALLHGGGVSPLFIDRRTQQSRSIASPMIAWFGELDEVALLLALTPNAIPVEVAHWLHSDDPDVSMVINGSVARISRLDLHSPQHHFPPDVTAESMNGLLPAFQTFNKRDKPRFTLAVERLVRSRCQQIPGNRAIDLAIALEVIFMGNHQGEHSYKISLRAARLLRDTVEARRAVFTQVQRVYELRSTMVHSGIGSDTYNVNTVPRTATDLVESVDVHCTEALRKILNLGAIPEDWRDIELS
ncbi:MAG: HEPN domain-containing protein [Pseudomonadota bacterium]|nr:HEPN domain-containing protein [Pseudomonadota bacterium]